MNVRIISGVITGLVFHLWLCVCVCPVGYIDDILIALNFLQSDRSGLFLMLYHLAFLGNSIQALLCAV